MTRAAAGSREPLASAIRATRVELIRRLAVGLHLAVFCSEDLPLRSSQEPERSSFARLEYEHACGGWPRAELAEDFRSPVRVDAAALLIAGEWDPATSPRWARIAADQFSKSQVVITPKQGHILGGLDGCIAAMTREFLDRGRADPSCAMKAKRLSYAVR